MSNFLIQNGQWITSELNRLWYLNIDQYGLRYLEPFLSTHTDEIFNRAVALIEHAAVVRNGMLPDGNEMLNFISVCIRGTIYDVMSQNNQGILDFQNDSVYMNNQLANAGYGRGQPQYGYNVPPQQQYQPGVFNQPAGMNHGGPGSHVAPPTNRAMQKSTVQYGRPATNTQRSGGMAAAAVVRPKERPMNVEDHYQPPLDTETRYVPETEHGPIVEEPLNSTKEEAAVEVKLIDKRQSEEFIGLDIGDPTPLLLATTPETNVDPVLLRSKFNCTIPASKPNQKLVDDLSELAEAETVDQAFGMLRAISRKYPAESTLGWIDTRITRLVELTIVKTLGQWKLKVGDYREEQDIVDGFLRKHGWLELVHNLILKWLTMTFETVKLSEVEKCHAGELIGLETFLTVSSLEDLLTLPWNARYSHSDSSIWLDGASTRQFYRLLDIAFSKLDGDIYLNFVDQSANHYRAWRLAPGNQAPSNYYIQSLDI